MFYTPKGCFELRACAVCGQRVAHRLLDGAPHQQHLSGKRHKVAVLCAPVRDVAPPAATTTPAEPDALAAQLELPA